MKSLMKKFKNTQDITLRCFVKPLKVINRFLNFFLCNNYRLEKDYKIISSNVPIDVVIPAIERDLDVLPIVIRGIMSNVKHPISNIKIISIKKADASSLGPTASTTGIIIINKSRQ